MNRKFHEYIEDTFEIDISSSDIRRKLRNKETIEELVHPELSKWLSSNYIYWYEGIN